jgi:putative membrane protein
MIDSSKRQVSMRLLALCLGTSAALIVPSAALGADLGAGGTVRATIGDNGSVTSVKQVSANGTTSAFSGELPIKMSITHTGSTYSYHVENTFTKTQTVHFTDTAGTERHTTVSLQLPLVAQLGVDVPKSMTNLNAAGATITTGANGVRHVLWNMVLFTPLGSSAQDVSLTASGSGSPIAELRATPVDPGTTPGLSAKSQDKTAEFQQEDFWAGYASGGNDGLKQLGSGVGQILDGLTQLLTGASELHAGLAGSLTGTQQAADGSTQLADGAKQLTAGLTQIHGGLSTDPTTGLTGGLALIHAGLSNDPATGLTGGLRLIHKGLAGKTGDPASGLVPGLTAIHTGLAGDGTAVNPGLAAGVQQIAGGLDLLDDPNTGLPTLLTQMTQLRAVLGQIYVGMGPTGLPASPGLLDGLTLIEQGLNAGIASLTQLDAGLLCGWNTIIVAANGQLNPGAPAAGCPALPALPGVDPLTKAILVGDATTPGVALQLEAAQTALDASLQTPSVANPNTLPALVLGVQSLEHAISHPAAGADPGGIKEILGQINAGLDAALDVNSPTGLPAALAGVHQLRVGADIAAPGAVALAAGSAGALDGAQQLSDGSAKALAGSKELYAGTGKALSGSRKLYAGSGEALSGSTQIRDGLSQLASGLRDGAKQFPQAVDGAGQIATGLGQVVPGEQQVKDGISQVLSGATGPLQQQLTQASQNAHQQIAVLQAASGLQAQAPGGAGTSYVLAQPGAISLAANATSTGGSSHTGRNAALIAIGGVVALVIGLGAGMALGRQRVSA